MVNLFESLKFRIYFWTHTALVVGTISFISYGVFAEDIPLSKTEVVSIGKVVIGLILSFGCLRFSCALFAKCPHCGKRALATNEEKSMDMEVSYSIPNYMKPLKILIRNEAVAGYCYCKNCKQRIDFVGE